MQTGKISMATAPNVPPQDGIQNEVILDDGTRAWYDASGDMVQKLGFTASLDGLAILCRVASKFRSVAKRVFPEDHIVIILYDLALILCSVMQPTFKGMRDGADADRFSGLRGGLADDLRQISDRLDGIA
jgi:hypothetical protein